MKLHEIRRNTLMFVAKKIKGATLDKHKFTRYYSTKNKTYLMEECKKVSADDFSKGAVWNPKRNVGIFSQIGHIKVDDDKTQIGIKTMSYNAHYFMIEEGDYIALVEIPSMNLFCNLSKEK